MDVEEAKRQIPKILRHVALTAIDATIMLDFLETRSRGLEVRVMSLQGYISYLMKLFRVVWKTPKEEDKAAHQAA